tara:strand:+ start:1109 stop:1996 length:888 start_codon:yes stop_codon:yes gene_type:complete
MEIRRRPPNPSIKVANLEYAIPHPDSKPKNILEEIVWEKDLEVETARKKVSLQDLKKRIKDLPETKDFVGALKNSKSKPALISEIKKASPSRGIIRKDFDARKIGKMYQKGGANCISVLTDKKFFQGGFDVLIEVRKEVKIPILCKDFILYPYQLYQARAAGADAALLITAILSDSDLKYLSKVAENLGLTILVEVHDSEELERVLNIPTFKLIGINNRNLKSFKTDLEVTKQLAENYACQIKENGITLVSESGLFTRTDLALVNSYGADAVLVGESLMSQKDILVGVKKLIGDL